MNPSKSFLRKSTILESENKDRYINQSALTCHTRPLLINFLFVLYFHGAFKNTPFAKVISELSLSLLKEQTNQ